MTLFELTINGVLVPSVWLSECQRPETRSPAQESLGGRVAALAASERLSSAVGGSRSLSASGRFHRDTASAARLFHTRRPRDQATPVGHLVGHLDACIRATSAPTGPLTWTFSVGAEGLEPPTSSL